MKVGGKEEGKGGRATPTPDI